MNSRYRKAANIIVERNLQFIYTPTYPWEINGRRLMDWKGQKCRLCNKANGKIVGDFIGFVHIKCLLRFVNDIEVQAHFIFK